MFIIEGNIGAGKSTFLAMLAQHLPSIVTRTEPLNQWHNEAYGQSLLEKFYQDPQRWAYTLETFTMHCRVQEHMIDQSLAENALCIVERSIFSGHHIFATNSFEQKFMNDTEWQLYSSIFNMVTASCRFPQGFIYLQTEPTSAFERINQRQRSAETTISLEYIGAIHQKHELLFASGSVVLKDHNYSPTIPVIIIDVNQDFEHDSALFAIHLAKVKEFIITHGAKRNVS